MNNTFEHFMLYSTESIDFQKTKFFEELTAYYENFDHARPNYQAVGDIIGKYTNLNVTVSNGGYWATSLLMLGENHVLFKDIFSQYKEYYGNFESDADIKRAVENTSKGFAFGTVDRHKAKVTGIFEKLNFKLWINAGDIKSLLTPKECAAVTLHEVGHQFTTFEYLGQKSTRNFAMANAVKIAGLKGKDDIKKIYLAKCAKDIGLSDDQSQRLSHAKTESDAYFVLMDVNEQGKDVLDPMQNMMRGNSYYTVNSEWAADDFATRCGAGQEVVSALAKIIDKGDAGRTAYNVLTILIFYMTPAFVTVGNPLVGLLWLSMNFAILTAEPISAQKHKRYDFDAERFKRVKNTLILQLRTGDNDSREQLREALAAIDNVEHAINTVKSETPAVFKFHSWIASLVSSDLTDSRKAERYQKGLETALNNQLYVQGYKAKQLADKLA